MLGRDTLRKIDQRVDSDEFLHLARNVADKANGLNDTQIRNLQNVVNSTTRFSEIMNYVKAQTGRHKEWEHLGPEIVKSLDKIDEYAGKIVGAEQDRGEVRLKLSRLWVKIVVAEFLYREIARN